MQFHAGYTTTQVGNTLSSLHNTEYVQNEQLCKSFFCYTRTHGLGNGLRRILLKQWKDERVNWFDYMLVTFPKLKFLLSVILFFCASTFYRFFALLLVHLNRRNSFFLSFFVKTRNGLITACHGCPRIMMGLRCCAFPQRRFGCLTSSSSTSKLKNASTFKWTKSQPKR